MRKHLNIIIKALVITIAITVINCILLVASYLLPTAPMRANVAATNSKQLILAEELYHRWDWGYTTTQVDGQSEYDLYGMAINEDAEGSAIERAMFMRYPDGDGLPRNESVLAYAEHIDGNYDQRAYTRYWNGSVMFLKVMLLFFNISDIRMLNYIVQTVLLVLIICLMMKNRMEKFIIPFLGAIIFINPFTMALSVKYSAEYIPMLLALIAILFAGNKIEKTNGGWQILFAVTGSVTAFMCMLSFPGITLGIPLLMLIWRNKEKNVIKTVITSCLFWGGAYAITWSLKWIIATLTTSYNFLEDAISQIFLYHSESGLGIVADRLVRNLWCIYNPVYILSFVVMLVSAVIIGIRFKTTEELSDNIKDLLIGYVLVALIPVTIIVGMGNGYANVHYYMAHRQLAISVAAALSLASALTKIFVYRKR